MQRLQNFLAAEFPVTPSVFTSIDGTKWVNLKTMDEIIGQLFLLNYSLGTSSTAKPFKQLGQIHDLQGPKAYELGGLLSHRKKTCTEVDCVQWSTPRGSWGRGLSMWQLEWTMGWHQLDKKCWHKKCRRRPDTRQKKLCWRLMIWTAAKPGRGHQLGTAQAVISRWITFHK